MVWVWLPATEAHCEGSEDVVTTLTKMDINAFIERITVSHVEGYNSHASLKINLISNAHIVVLINPLIQDDS